MIHPVKAGLSTPSLELCTFHAIELNHYNGVFEAVVGFVELGELKCHLLHSIAFLGNGMEFLNFILVI